VSLEPNDAGATSFVFVIPPEHQAGVYAHTFAVWHTPYDFTIDFAVSQLAEAVDSADDATSVIPARLVARVRIPPGTVF
jgi:hypothetical protein